MASRFLIAAIGAASIGLFASTALSYTEEQENVLQHAAEAIAASQRCDNLEPNYDIISLGMLTYGIPATDERHIDALRSRTAEAIEEFRRHDDEVICTTGEMLFGPQGINVPNILIVR